MLNSSLLKKMRDLWAMLRQYPVFRRRSYPIESIDGVRDFAVTRSAFIAQKTMFGYVKTRMGTSYPEMFRDDLIITSLKEATMQHYAACLSDLTTYLFRDLAENGYLNHAECTQHAKGTFRSGLESNKDHSLELFDMEKACITFEARIRDIAWSEPVDPFKVFIESPRSLTRWAPIADDLKKRDREIAENSVSFAWIEVRKEFRDLLQLPKQT
ncbi:MAG: hypothetical protein VW421_05050 [Gammaproteobacteria bacterium]